MDSLTQSAGTILAGKYRLMDLLGRGGMGSVWRAEHLGLESLVAIKLVDPVLASHPEARERFLREARAAAALRSPHVVQILDHGVESGTPYIVMELLEGENLADRLTRVGRLAPSATADLIVQVCRAVARAHERGIVHRDLKPDNIFLSANEDAEMVKVLDFGVAKRVALDGPKSMTQTGAVLGTPYYMSPEQAEGSRSVDYHADLWALGVIAFECMTGQRPFDAESLGGLVLAICTRPIPVPSQVASVPSGFDEWFARATARDPNQRFASARELSASLQALCGSNRQRVSSVTGGAAVASAAATVHESSGPGEAAGSPGRGTSRLGTSAAGSLVRSSLDDEAIDLPLSHAGKRVAWFLASVLGLAAMAAAIWWQLRAVEPGAPGTASSAATTPAAAAAAPIGRASSMASVDGELAQNAGSGTAPSAAPSGQASGFAAPSSAPAPLPVASSRPRAAPPVREVRPPKSTATKPRTPQGPKPAQPATEPVDLGI